MSLELLVEVETTERTAISFDVVKEEFHFLADPKEADRKNRAAFALQPEYCLNEQVLEQADLNDPRLQIHYRGSDEFVPDVVATKELPGRQTWGETLRHPGRKGVVIEGIYSVLESYVAEFVERRPLAITRGAAVFNVRLKLGLDFTPEKFMTALGEFISKRPAIESDVIVISFWRDDLQRNSALKDDGLKLITPTDLTTNIDHFRALAENFKSVKVLGLEFQIMNESERERQRKMHSSEPPEDHLEVVNHLLTGLGKPV